MQNILLLGAGRSATSLINYLKDKAEKENWKIRLGDFDVSLANEKAAGHPSFSTIQFDILNKIQSREEIENADLVISMLPAFLHFKVAEICVDLGKHLVTASYNNPEINGLSDIAKSKNTLILMECGLDPGIDHMTAMAVIDEIKEKGGELTSFKSYTGGLIAPESDNNPWHYKFTWNPRNVILAGQGAAKFIRNGRYKYIPYHRLFTRLDQIHVNGLGDFEGYPNRDSLSYRKIYGLEKIPTLLRGTLRKVGFSEAWNVFVQIGITDDTYEIEGLESMTNRDFVNAFLKYEETQSIEDKLCEYVGIQRNSETFEKLKWLGIFDETELPLKKGSPAQVLQAICEKKLSLEEGDKDMIVMQHQFEYLLDGKKHYIDSSIVSYGENEHETAMAKTVGLPIGIAVKNILNGNIKLRGVHIPIVKELYEPILKELVHHGVSINETHS
ncbi:saccharopine dehydrogenase NADP-binding domain-containing protein [Marivirga sp. S37H4]|uniref:Saccharopine dehydrogenase NADP-binding domain-containing protein n=1 Tax=Marivirga aurantiaca TaxID=2802615 RepID=A0A934WVE9_9BACT|nr:saccharopine dehydrogenase C-terminal domain-containing protein [Marivirga aurantiaca]MBK6263655.1 saccharopine dehydrogenase NADP-binding domain-containing protein [Marivirga aurantiaca]